MTVLRVYTDVGRLDRPLRENLSESLTNAVLEVEVGQDSSVGRRGVMVLFEEVPEGSWAVGGKLDQGLVGPGGRVLIEAQAMQGVWTPERREALIDRLCASVAEALGHERGDQSTCWVLLDQIPDGSWGAFGGVVRIGSLLEVAGFSEDRRKDVAEELARDR